MSRSMKALEEILQKLQHAAQEGGLVIHHEKTKFVAVSKEAHNEAIQYQ